MPDEEESVTEQSPFEQFEGLLDTGEEPAEEVAEAPDTGEAEAEEGSLDPALVTKAESIGFSAEDLEAFGDRAEDMINRFERQYVEKFMNEQEGEEPAAVEAEKSGEAKQSPEALTPNKALEILKEEGYDEETPIYKAIETVVSAQEDRISKIEQAFQQQVVAQEQQRLDAEMDEFFGNQPEEMNALWGGKNLLEAAQDPRYQADVKKVFNAMNAYRDSWAKMGNHATTAEIGKAALQYVFSDKMASMSSAEKQEKVQKRQKSFTSKPTSREKPPAAPRTRDEQQEAFEKLLNRT